MVGNLRRSVDPNAATLDQIPEFDVAQAYRLYQLLLKPVETGWSGARTLIVVPHRVLGELPLSLLVTMPTNPVSKGPLPFASYKSVPFLVRQPGVAQLPSVGALATCAVCRRRPARIRASRASAIRGSTPNRPVTRPTTRARESKRRTKVAAFRSAVAAPRPATTARSRWRNCRASRYRRGGPQHRDDAARRSGEGWPSAPLPTNRRYDAESCRPPHHRVRHPRSGAGDLAGLTQPALALSAPNVANVGGDGLLTVDKIRSAQAAIRN